jgi:hypothetical protein
LLFVDFFRKVFVGPDVLNDLQQRGVGREEQHRLGCINIRKDWDAVLLALLDENFNATEIHEAKRKAVLSALLAPSSKARNERGALRVSKFKSVGKLSFSLAERLAL